MNGTPTRLVDTVEPCQMCGKREATWVFPHKNPNVDDDLLACDPCADYLEYANATCEALIQTRDYMVPGRGLMASVGFSRN